MPIKLYGFTASHNVQKVMWACAELDLDFERLEIAGKAGGTDTAQFLAMNPNRRVPVIEDGELVLWESHAILRYLAATYGVGTLWQEDPRIRARADRWMDWQLSTISEPMRICFWGLIRTPPEKRDMAAIKKAAEDAGRLFGRLDGWLEGRKYVAGQHLTMGDIPVGCFVYRWYALDIERPELKNVRAWYERLGTRPGYAKHIMIKLT